MKYAFFPGCSLESTAWDFSRSTKEVFKSLDVELEEIEDWVCCGSTPAHATDTNLSWALPAINLHKAEQMGHPLVASCASCYARFRTTNNVISENDTARETVEAITGQPYHGGVDVRHILDVLVNDVGLKKIREKVKQPLKGLKVACYYGCLLTRPQKVVAFDNPENPMVMDDLLQALGAETVEWPYKTECCGASHAIPNPEVVERLSHRILAMAREAGADCLAVACQMCQMNLDLGQTAATKKHGDLEETPVFYATQLLGLALGLSPERVGLRALIVNPKLILDKINMDRAS